MHTNAAAQQQKAISFFDPSSDNALHESNGRTDEGMGLALDPALWPYLSKPGAHPRRHHSHNFDPSSFLIAGLKSLTISWTSSSKCLVSAWGSYILSLIHCSSC